MSSIQEAKVPAISAAITKLFAWCAHATPWSRTLFIVYLIGTASLRASASDFDPFFTHSAMSSATTNSHLADATLAGHCRFASLPSTITLLASVQRALCTSPKIHEAWATAATQAAQLGIADSAYLPTLTVTGGMSPGNLSERIGTTPPYDFKKTLSTTGVNVDFNWIFYDFGLRDANAEAADQALIASVASRDATIQRVIVETAEAYYDVATAQALLDAKMVDEKTAAESYETANGKYKLGAAALTEKLQAQTSYSRAQLDRTKAEGTLASVMGHLDILMGLPPTAAFRVTALDISGSEMAQAITPINEMIAYAERKHPAILAARANLRVSRAKVGAAEAYELPTVSLTANYSNSRQVGQFIEPLPADITQGTVGVQLSVPLSGLVERSYQIQAAEADEIEKKASLDDAIEQTSLDIWTNYQALEVAKAESKTAAVLVQNAKHAFEVARGRYHAGVGNILELLTAQSALADAEQQRVTAMSDWLTARIKLTASLGKLDLSTLQ